MHDGAGIAVETQTESVLVFSDYEDEDSVHESEGDWLPFQNHLPGTTVKLDAESKTSSPPKFKSGLKGKIIQLNEDGQALVTFANGPFVHPYKLWVEDTSTLRAKSRGSAG